MKNTSNLIAGPFCTRIGWMVLFFLLPFMAVAQSYEELWKEVELTQQKDLPRSAMQLMDRIYDKAEKEKNVPQLMKAQLSKAVEQVKLSPDSAEVEVKRLQAWAESETNPLTAALLYHVMGNVKMQQEEADWKEAMNLYRRALEDKELLLKTPARDFAPMTVSTDFSRRYFQDNLYDLLVRQTIAGLMANWQWRKQLDVQEWIIDLYDSLIEAYGTGQLNMPAAALLSHAAKIAFLSEEGVAGQYHLSMVQKEKALRDLLNLYTKKVSGKQFDSKQVDGKLDDDALVDVHLKLAETLCAQEKLVEAMEMLKVAQKEYPKSDLMSEVRGKMEWINAPALSMEIPMVYPKYRGNLVVNYKNLTKIKLETYWLQLNPASAELNSNHSMDDLCRTYGKRVDKREFKLPQTTDYKPRIETLSYQLPKEGIYVMKVTPLGRKGRSDYQVMYVSPYQCVLIPLLDGRTEVVVLDRLTGNPIPHAEIVTYQRDTYNAHFHSSKTWQTDKQGSVILTNPRRGALYVNARTSDSDYMKITSFYPGRDHRLDVGNKTNRLTALFTDRALYRPGQVVHVSGLRYEQMGDSLRTLQGQVMKLELLDVNGKKVGESSATSDWFGVFATDFTIPQQVLPGQFTLRTENKAITIRVENYKRPTFDVTFNPMETTYTFDDQVQVEGKAETFAGAPVRLAKGTYMVARSEAWLWRAGGAETALATGSFQTDEKGHFSLDVRLESPISKQNMDLIPYYNYVVRAVVTDGAGETQESVLTLPVGKRSMGLQIKGLKPKLACERKEKIQFQAMNLKKQLVKTEVTYQVYQADQLVFEGKALSQTSFVPLEIYALPAGKYLMKAQARDDQGRQVTTSQEFVLFSLADKRPPIETAQWFYQDGDNWENGNTVSLYVGSSENNIYLLTDVYTSKQRIRSERMILKNSIQRFDFTYDESYGDGIVVSFAFLREGKLYTKQVKLEKPKPQKELTMQWESFRDQLTPGEQEVWRMKITDHVGNAVRANLLGVLYDASLDKLQAHNWYFHPYFNRWLPYIGVRSFSHDNQTRFFVDFPYLQNMNGFRLLGHDTYSRLLSFILWNRPYYYYAGTRAYASPEMAMKSAARLAYGPMANGVMNEDSNQSIAEDDFVVNSGDMDVIEITQEEESTPLKENNPQLMRTNFAETAFYYPTLRTDDNGEVSISFTLPDALTEWKFMGLAHTQHLDYGLLTSKVKSSKPFMVQPNLPRFVRLGDASTLAVSLVNLSMEAVAGKVRLELIDPSTNQLVFKQEKNFEVAEGETGTAHFSYKVLGNYEVLICRVVADAGEFSDGEQHYLPILTNKEWVTETIPFQVKGNETTTVSLKDAYNHRSRTATGKRLTVELTANPNWYVIQALSVVSNPTNEDAISWTTAYYANALAMQLVRTHPHIQQVFSMWQAEGATKETLWSKLETNTDLKQLLLEETPWLAEAKTEAEQKRRVALLFELNGMEQRLQLAARQLKRLQTPEGGWTWYPDMPVNRYTSTQVVEMLARLKTKGIRLDGVMDEAYLRGLDYLRREAKKEYESMLEREKNAVVKRQLQPSNQVVHYLYICALDVHAQQLADPKVNAFFVERLVQGGTLGIHEKALTAIILQANGKNAQASTLMKSVKEYLVSSAELGYYFDTHKAAYSWNSYRIPTHVAAMEAINRISPNVRLLDGMKLWLLKQKQVQAWNTPLASVNAIHAFLLGSESAELMTAGKMTAQLGNQNVVTPNDGLGYTRVTFTGDKLPVVKGKSTVRVQKEGEGIGWGAVYMQYFEEMSKIQHAANKGISIERTYLLDGEVISSNQPLHVGDEVTIRLTVKVDCDMDFVSIKDQRAACMEPAEQLSGYSWQKGISTYRVNRDASTSYFIDKLPKGKHVLEYQVYINREGTYQSGTASIQSVYAPEFAAHTKGLKITIENR